MGDLFALVSCVRLDVQMIVCFLGDLHCSDMVLVV